VGDARHYASERLADELRRTIMSDAWHGPSVLETIHGVSLTQAVWRPSPEMHSIWEIILHVAAWQVEGLEVVGGRAYRTMPETEQWPPVGDVSAEAWQALLWTMEAANQELVASVGALSPQDLLRPIEEREYNLEFLLHGIAQHNAYHAGQLTILKRLALAAGA
jgi:hypothetical protein